MQQAPIFIDVFLQPLRDNQAAQVAFVAFVALMVLDILLGLAAAAKSGTIKSSKMREGLWHKTGELGVVAIGDVIDGMMLGGIDLNYSAPMTTGLIVYLALNEAVSCMENAAKIDPGLNKSPLWQFLHETVKHDEGEEDPDA